MTNIYEAVTKFMQDDGWPFERVGEEPIARTLFQGDHAQFVCFAQAREEQQQFTFYSMLPVMVPEHKRAEVAEFITRANYDMVVGNFELDLDDGDVRYKTSIDVEDAELTPALIRPLFYANVLMMDQYLPGLMAVIYADVSPADAIAQIEEPGDEP
jgi:hypothetical protein